MKKSNTVLLTTIFPLCFKYFDEFLNSLLAQTDKNFDLLVVNDGVENFEDQIEKYPEINIIEVVSESSIVENRKVGIKAVLKLNYEYLLFGDSDDYFDNNRIAISKQFLKKYDIVVNDLTLFDDNGIYSKSYYSKRIDDLLEINLDFIQNKNILGLSNTAVRTEAIGELYFCDNLVALDWYFFSKLLFENKTAVYTDQTQTYYRQHQDNTVGLGDDSIESIKRAIKVKKIHYQCMTKISNYFDKLLFETCYLEENFENLDFERDKIRQMNLLWWETPNYKINN